MDCLEAWPSNYYNKGQVNGGRNGDSIISEVDYLKKYVNNLKNHFNRASQLRELNRVPEIDSTNI